MNVWIFNGNEWKSNVVDYGTCMAHEKVIYEINLQMSGFINEMVSPLCLIGFPSV